MKWELNPLSSSPASLGSLPGTSSVTFSANSVGAVTLGQTSGLPLTVSPTPTEPAPDPTPAPTVTVTQTVAPPGPSEVSGTVKLDDAQFLGLTSGMVLLLLFVVAAFVAQMRRP